MGVSIAESMSRAWVDDDGKLLMGKHKGEYLQDVAIDYPKYLGWVLDNVEDLADDDREVIAYWYERAV